MSYENIPEELKQRDQWLLWDSSADTPRQPHWRGDFRGISWSDPSDWHSFEEAVEAANERESWGVGYVMAYNNDDHARGLYGCIDIDGANREVGEEKLKEWVPALDGFIDDDAYIEFSPSGEGLHIPFVGHDAPDWWADCQIDDHEGVDVLLNKFCTFTGDTVSVSGDTVTDSDPAPWLFKAYEAIRGEKPNIRPSKEAERRERGRDGSGGYDGDEWLTDELVEAALSKLDPDAGYNEWRDIAFAVHDYDSGSNGRRLFENWSQSGTKYDDDAERYIEAIWENADAGSEITVATLVQKAKEAGWEVPSAGGDKSATEDVSETDDDGHTSWEYVRSLFKNSDVDDRRARRAAAVALLDRHDFLYIDTEDRLLKYHEPTGVFEPGGERDAKKILVRELGGLFSTHDRNEIIATIQDLKAVDVETLNAEEFDRKLRCLKNGVLDLETRELLEHSPEYRFTQTVPVEYDPNADAPNAEAFLESITRTDGEKKTLEEMIGAALHPDYLKSKFLFLFGEGQNGKGVYFELLSHLLGTENVQGRGLHELANERFAKADLHGKLANIGGDIDDRKLKNVGELKRLTSNTDPVTAERKYGQPFKFTNSATLFFAANEPPAIEDKKRSMARRIVPIHMAIEFVEQPDPDDPHQKQAVEEEKLLADMTTDEELSGLLNLALDGMSRLVENGDVSLEMGPMERLEYYQRFSDPIYRFAAECLNKTHGETVEKADVYEVYKEFSRAEGHGVRHSSVFWREFKRVFHFEQRRPRGPDGKKKQRELVDTEFTETALEAYAPTKLNEKYGTVAGDSDDTDGGEHTFEGVSTGFNDFNNVTVAEILEPADWQAGKGHLVDGGGTILPYVCEGSDPLTLADEGDTISLQNVKVEDRKAGLTLVLSGVTRVGNQSRPDGQADLETADAAADGGTETATADGSDDEMDETPDGSGGPAELVSVAVEAVEACVERGAGDDPAAHGEAVSWITEHTDLSLHRADDALDEAKTRGAIHAVAEGKYRPT